jgi:hypothetical protein
LYTGINLIHYWQSQQANQAVGIVVTVGRGDEDATEIFKKPKAVLRKMAWHGAINFQSTKNNIMTKLFISLLAAALCTAAQAQTKWVEYDQQYGYHSYNNGKPIADVIRNPDNNTQGGNKLEPYKMMRKAGEKGTFHFAKDYPELAAYTMPENPGVRIVFYSSPGKNSETQTAFNSGTRRIYAKLETSDGSIKDALGLPDKGVSLSVRFYVFGDEYVKQLEGLSKLYVPKNIAQGKVVEFGVMPDPNNQVIYLNPDDKNFPNFYSMFYQMHTQNNFPKNGDYKIGVKLSYAKTDDWGKPTNNVTGIWGFFDYTFDAKDVAGIQKEGRDVSAKSKEFQHMNEPLPAEWGKPSSAVNSGYSAAEIQKIYLQSKGDRASNMKIIKFYASPNSGMGLDKTDLGIPRQKFTNQEYTVFYKETSTDKCYYQQFSLAWAYLGGGAYAKQPGLILNDNILVDCAKLK